MRRREVIAARKALATPPWASIRELEHASLQLEKEEQPNTTEHIQWLNMLIAPGSSLGGARPKANILDEKGHLWIAKFLTKRFDRNDAGRRIYFVSAMTLLGYTDGTSYADGVSYLELAEWIMSNCNNTDKNLEQLWRRIVFNIAVSNCDDHLRNHGFILTDKGWQLSPAYDINPDENGMGLKLNISEDDNSLDFELALSQAKYFGLNDARANTILAEIKSVVSNWRKYANECDIPRSEQELVAGAFRY